MENWFRVHTSILDSRKFEGISLAARGLWVTIGALVKERGDPDGKLVRRDGSPINSVRLAKEIGYSEPEVSMLLSELIDAGLIELDEDGYYRMHDWREWQTREEEREQWRERQRRHRNGGTPQRATIAEPSEEPTQATQEEKADVTQCHAMSRSVTQCHAMSRDVTERHLESKNKSKSKSENNISRSAHSAPRGGEVDLTDPDIAFILAKYQQHGLAPPEGEALRQEKSALRALEQKHAVTRTQVSEAADWMFVTFAGKKGFGVLYRHWEKIAERMAQQQARASPPPRKEEPKPAYYRVVSAPSEWGGLG